MYTFSFAVFLIAVIVPLIKTEKSCVLVNFESGLKNFDDSIGLCSSAITSWASHNCLNNFNGLDGQCSSASGVWHVGHYKDIDIKPPHEFSTTFIKSNAFSCTSSFDIEIHTSGTLEVTFYISTQDIEEFLQVIVNERQQNGELTQTSDEKFNSSTSGITNHGWNKVSLAMEGTGNYKGFISFMGSTDNGSIILVDSFRYIPPEFDESLEECVIYEPGKGVMAAYGKDSDTGEDTPTSEENTTIASGEDTKTTFDKDNTTTFDEDTSTGPGEDATVASDEDTTTSEEDTTILSGVDTKTTFDKDNTITFDEDTMTGLRGRVVVSSSEPTTAASVEDTAITSGEDTMTASIEDTITKPATDASEQSIFKMLKDPRAISVEFFIGIIILTAICVSCKSNKNNYENAKKFEMKSKSSNNCEERY